MGTPLATAIACCVAERERGIWMTRYMKEWRNIKLYQFSGPFWNVAWILFDHLHHTDLHCIVTPWGSKPRFSDTTSPMAGKNMSCLTFCEKRCVYYICGLQAFKYFSSVAGATHSEWCLNLSTPMLTHRTLQENRFDVHWRSLFSQHSRYFGTFPCSPSTIEILNTEMSECNI